MELKYARKNARRFAKGKQACLDNMKEIEVRYSNKQGIKIRLIVQCQLAKYDG